MARDVPINTPLFFYDESFIWTGEIGNSGDSDDFTLPPGMTDVPIPWYVPKEKQAVFNETTQEWTAEWINPYDGWTPEEQAIYDAEVLKQAGINEALKLVDEKLYETLDLTVQFIESKFDLIPAEQNYLNAATTIEELKTVLVETLSITPAQKAIIDAFHASYAAYISAKES